MKFIVVEDNAEMAEAVALALEVSWPEAVVITTNSGKKAVCLVEDEHPDLVVLDLGLPDMDGCDVLKEIRLFSTVPALVLTVRDEEMDVVKCLERGADDYVIKPFRQMELMSRVRAILRRHHLISSFMPPSTGKLRFGNSIHQFYVDDLPVGLTSTEGIILSQLIRNAEKVVTLSSLSELIWDVDHTGSYNAIRVYIRRIRKKIEQDPENPKIILTHPGMGYSLHQPDS
ncbi:MAG: response regulator transcription factor [Dehalococcoidales bacterium]|nr:response regulator transcription factor [Dehalococcoidales bacterium]